MSDIAQREKFDWKKYVEESNGRSIYLPEEFLDEAKGVKEREEAFNKLIAETIAKEELEINMANQNLWLKVRRFLAENGFADIWSKNVGFNVDARKEGEFIVNIQEPRG